MNIKSGRTVGCSRGQYGFTLIELMIVVVIAAVLLGIALPAYQNQIIRGHRAEAKSEMLDIANRQEQYLLANRGYTADPNDISYTLPPEVARHYSFNIDTTSTSGAPFYEITFTAIGEQAVDGNLALNSEGGKTPTEKWER